MAVSVRRALVLVASGTRFGSPPDLAHARSEWPAQAQNLRFSVCNALQASKGLSHQHTGLAGWLPAGHCTTAIRTQYTS